MRNSLLFMVIAVLLVGCGGDGQDTSGLQNLPTLPVDTLKVVLSIGEELGDSTNTFSAITSSMIDDYGRILVLDQVSADLRFYDSLGNYVTHLARRGNGPGELQMPWGMFSMPDGRLMVLDLGKQGFVVFDDSLRYLEELNLWVQNPPFEGTAVSDSQYVAYKVDTDAADNRITMRRSVALFSYGEAEWDSAFWQDSISVSMSEIIENPSMFIIDMLDPLSLGGDGLGMIYFSLKDGEEYTVTAWNASGEEELSFSMDLYPVEKTAEEIAAESTYVTNYISRMAGGGGGGFQFEFEPDPFKDMVIEVDIGPDENLWVRRGTMDSPFFDIFDPSTGELLHHVIFPEDGWSWITRVSRNGIVAWEEDPVEGYQKLYILE